MESVERFNENQRDQQQEQDDTDRRNPTVGGFNLNVLSGRAGAIYVFAIFGIIFATMYYCN